MQPTSQDLSIWNSGKEKRWSIPCQHSRGKLHIHGAKPRKTRQKEAAQKLSIGGEGTGDPLQYSCLENPRDGGAWWAAVYGVAQSRTQLTWLSSSSSSLTGRQSLELWVYQLKTPSFWDRTSRAMTWKYEQPRNRPAFTQAMWSTHILLKEIEIYSKVIIIQIFNQKLPSMPKNKT